MIRRPLAALAATILTTGLLAAAPHTALATQVTWCDVIAAQPVGHRGTRAERGDVIGRGKQYCVGHFVVQSVRTCLQIEQVHWGPVPNTWHTLSCGKWHVTSLKHNPDRVDDDRLWWAHIVRCTTKTRHGWRTQTQGTMLHDTYRSRANSPSIDAHCWRHW